MTGWRAKLAIVGAVVGATILLVLSIVFHSRGLLDASARLQAAEKRRRQRLAEDAAARADVRAQVAQSEAERSAAREEAQAQRARAEEAARARDEALAGLATPKTDEERAAAANARLGRTDPRDMPPGPG